MGAPVKDLHGNNVEPFWYHSSYRSVYKIRADASYGDLVEYLGRISSRKDGRFDWWRHHSRYYDGQWGGLAQGVADTLSEAMVAIEKGWNNGSTDQK